MKLKLVSNTSKRLKEALSIRNMKQSELCEKTKIGKSSISTYLQGEYKPKQDNLSLLALALDVNETWLMGYDVDMQRLPPMVKKLSNDKLNLLSNYDRLNQLGKEKAIERISELVYIPRYSLTPCSGFLEGQEIEKSKIKSHQPTED